MCDFLFALVFSFFTHHLHFCQISSASYINFPLKRVL